MLYEHNEVTEMIDVYSMGNIFYKLLTNERKYDDLSTLDAQELIKKNVMPPISPYLQISTFPIHVALKNAITMTLQRYPKRRKSAEDIYRYLEMENSKFQETLNGSEGRFEKN